MMSFTVKMEATLFSVMPEMTNYSAEMEKIISMAVKMMMNCLEKKATIIFTAATAMTI